MDGTISQLEMRGVFIHHGFIARIGGQELFYNQLNLGCISVARFLWKTYKDRVPANSVFTCVDIRLVFL